jgi:predicted transcriptional regulator
MPDGPVNDRLNEDEEEPSQPATPVKPAEREARKRYLKLAGFGLPESPYDTIKAILRAMSKLGGAGTQVTNQQVAETAGISSRVVSGNNRFLLSTGIISRTGSTFSLTDKGVQLALAIDYSDLEESSRAWRSIASDNDFLKKILGAVDIRGGMTPTEFTQYIARTAGAPNEPDFIRGAKAISDILIECGLVKEAESGKFVVTPEYRRIGTGTPVAEEPVVEGQTDESLVLPKSASIGMSIVVNVNATLTPETTAADVDNIASRIKQLKEKLQS